MLANAIERALGRTRDIRYGPRTIDIDILLYDNLIIREPDLEIPHPRMLSRAFVLVPLAEIAGDIIFPGTEMTIKACKERLTDSSQVRLWKE